jgi:hypothetical protein
MCKGPGAPGTKVVKLEMNRARGRVEAQLARGVSMGQNVSHKVCLRFLSLFLEQWKPLKYGKLRSHMILFYSSDFYCGKMHIT